MLGTWVPCVGAGPTGALLTVEGAVRQKLSLVLSELAVMPHRTVQVLNSHTGRTDSHAGALLTEVLGRAGVPQGRELRGSALALVLLAEAAAGYRAAFALAELDPASGDAQVHLADRLNGNPLDAEQGPLKPIVPRDRRPARSVRNLKILRVVAPPG